MAVPCCRSVSGSAVGHRQHSLSEYSHPPLTRRERKKTLPISPFVRVVAPSAREAPICLSFHFQHFIKKKKKKANKQTRNLLNLSSLLLSNQQFTGSLRPPLNVLKVQKPKAGRSGESLLSVSGKRRSGHPNPNPHPIITLKFGFFGQFLFTPIDHACYFLIYWWEDC